MEPRDVAQWIAEALPCVTVKASYGETAWFYNPGGFFANGTYFLTLKRANGPNDRASRLDREGVWRLSFGLPPSIYEERFGPRPARPAKGGICDGGWAYDAIDVLHPHPIYGWMGWVAVNAPTRRRLEEVKPLIHAAYDKARAGFEKRTRAAA